MELGDSAQANIIIASALTYERTPSWIWHRVNMAAGDIALKQKRFEESYRRYTVCAEMARQYGDEGHGYQIAPRLGLACLGLDRLDDAQKHFESILGFQQITAGHMYANYGLALVAKARGELDHAEALLNEVRAEHFTKARSSLLLKLIDQMSLSLG